MTPSHLAARLALLLRVDVDGRLVDTCECVVPWIVPEEWENRVSVLLLVLSLFAAVEK